MADAELTNEDIKFIKELREARDNQRISRREALGLLAGVGMGAGAGAYGVQSVEAAASTSDGDGNVGLPGDRVDVFADGVDTPTITDADDGTTYDVGSDLAQGGALSDSGTDTDGGNNYQLPSAADNIDLQSDGAIQNAQSVNTDVLNGGGTVTDGDGTERQIWVIANGASDPAGADAEDIIFEEQA